MQLLKILKILKILQLLVVDIAFFAAGVHSAKAKFPIVTSKHEGSKYMYCNTTVTATRDGTIWFTTGARSGWKWHGHACSITAVGLDPDGAQIWVAGHHGCMACGHWDLACPYKCSTKHSITAKPDKGMVKKTKSIIVFIGDREWSISFWKRLEGHIKDFLEFAKRVAELMNSTLSELTPPSQEDGEFDIKPFVPIILGSMKAS